MLLKLEYLSQDRILLSRGMEKLYRRKTTIDLQIQSRKQAIN